MHLLQQELYKMPLLTICNIHLATDNISHKVESFYTNSLTVWAKLQAMLQQLTTAVCFSQYSRCRWIHV